MNYRHAFHAGNFADVVKHAVLVRLVEYLKRKEKPFRVIDTHAGAGLYDLGEDAAARTGEWRAGIGRLLAKPPRGEAAALLSPYLDIVSDCLDAAGAGHLYPGSPVIIRRLLRRGDRLTAIELHPDAAAALAGHFSGDVQARIIELDGWLALGAHVPPKEKRGLVLVDPPFERPGEFDRMAEGLERAWRRWPGGLYAFWYPIKDRAAVSAFVAGLAALEIPRILDVRLSVRDGGERLEGSGMILVNPPFVLETELSIILPALHAVLAEPGQGNWSVGWIAGERASKL